MVEALDAVNEPTVHRAAFATKAAWPEMSVVPRLRNPAAENNFGWSLGRVVMVGHTEDVTFDLKKSESKNEKTWGRASDIERTADTKALSPEFLIKKTCAWSWSAWG